MPVSSFSLYATYAYAGACVIRLQGLIAACGFARSGGGTILGDFAGFRTHHANLRQLHASLEAAYPEVREWLVNNTDFRGRRAVAACGLSGVCFLDIVLNLVRSPLQSADLAVKGRAAFEEIAPRLQSALPDPGELNGLLSELEVEYRAAARQMAPLDQEPDWVFAQDGDGYYVKAFGRSGHFKATVGFRRLEKLLRHAGRAVPMADLVRDEDEAQTRPPVGRLEGVVETDSGDEQTGCGFQFHPPDGSPGESVLDTEALRAIRDKTQGLDQEIAEAKSSADSGRQERLQAEKEELVSWLHKDTGLRGKIRQTKGPADAMRTTIQHSLKREYEKLRASKPESLNELADHLEVHISARGAFYIYSPTPAPCWSFDRK